MRAHFSNHVSHKFQFFKIKFLRDHVMGNVGGNALKCLLKNEIMCFRVVIDKNLNNVAKYICKNNLLKIKYVS
jgi:hypothetical protein